MPWPIMPMPMKPMRGVSCRVLQCGKRDVVRRRPPAARALAPEGDQPRVARGDVGDDRLVVARGRRTSAAAASRRSSGRPRSRGRSACGAAMREAARERVLARLEAEQQDAAAVRVVARDRRRRCGSQSASLPRRRQLPPVGADAGGVDLRRARAPACRRRAPSRAAGSLRPATRGRWRRTPPAARRAAASCAARSAASSSGW